MNKKSCYQTALFIGARGNDDDAAVVVVGGWGGTEKETALLTNRPHQVRAEQGNRGGQWRWRQLTPMHEKRPCQPGLLLLGRRRVLVCGGAGWITTAEMLQLPRGDNGGGVWTLLTQPMRQHFSFTYLVNFNNRIVAVGESLINLGGMKTKQHFYINCIHFRQAQGLRRVDNNLHFHAPGKKFSINRSLRVLSSTSSHSFCLSGGTTGDLRVEIHPQNTV